MKKKRLLKGRIKSSEAETEKHGKLFSAFET
jgi:hypothetical protein